MKITTLIIEDRHFEYEEIKKMLLGFDFIKIVGGYMGEQPFDEALEYINREKPQLLIIDYELGHGSHKNGLSLFENIEKYKCFAIFCSRLPEAVNTDSGYINAKFIRKELEPIISNIALTKDLDLAKSYLSSDKEVCLKFYKSGKSESRDIANIYEEIIPCKNLVRLLGDGKQYSYVYYDCGKFITRTGPASKGVGIIVDHILESAYPDFTVQSHSPYLLYNKNYFNRNTKNKEYSLKDSYESEKRFKFGG